ncbi:MAG: hypothetical protein U1E62_05910 [Alsobacter sp.]
MTAPARRPLVASPAADAPLRQPALETRRPDIRIEAGRHLRASLWLVLVMGVGLAIAFAARPAPQPEAFRVTDKALVLKLPAPLAMAATATGPRTTAIR